MFNGEPFITWEQMTNYLTNVLNIHYDLDNPEPWIEAYKKLTKGAKATKLYNTVTGDSVNAWVDDNWYGNGEWIRDDTIPDPDVSSGTATNSASTGGTTSAPTAKSVYTNSQTKTATITEDAIGIKNTGISTFSKGINVLSGLLQCYGLIHAGVKIYNSGVWRDMINEVFDADIEGDPDADLMDKVINYLEDKVVNSITSLNTDGKLISTIPDSIAEKLYNFLSQHIINSGGTVVECSITNNLSVWYNFVNRQYAVKPNTTIRRYISVTNPDTKYTYDLAPITDQFFTYVAADFIAQLIAGGFIVAANTAETFVENIEGLTEVINTHTAGHGALSNLCLVAAIFNRDTSVPKETPISLSELELTIVLQEEDQMDIVDTPEGTIINRVDFSGSGYGGTVLPEDALVYPSDKKSGDFLKYAKRNTNGNNDNEYGYWITINRTSDTPNAVDYCEAVYRYEANEPVKGAAYRGTRAVNQTLQYGMNGYYVGDIQDSMIRLQPMPFYYCNVGCKGYATGTPDSYLTEAGFLKKGNEKNPDPNKTKEEQYPGMAQKIQNARPSRTAEGGSTNVIDDYTPASIPYGDENADRLINSGMNNSDPSSYKDNRSQTAKQKGEINTDDPITGYNEDTDRAIKQYNDSDIVPDYYPDPLPDNVPNPTYPVNPPAVPDGDTDTPPEPGTMEGVEASGMVSVYNPTKAQIISFSGWLWSSNFLDNFLKIFQNPMDGIIGLHILYATPSTAAAPENIRVGYLDSGVSSKVVDKQFIEVDCGYVTIPEYYGTAIDYEPYVQIHAYLPFVGIVSLKPNDVIGKKLYCKYGVDVLTGTCLAMLTAKDKTSEILLYTFSGNCATQVPISGGNYAQIISGLASMAVGIGAGVATGNPIAVAGGVVAGVMSSHLDVTHSGSIGANAGAMGPRKPYVVITRKSAYDAGNYNQFYGYPANKTVTLGSCKGYTRVKSVHIDSIGTATDKEKIEIETLLKQGVIIIK